MDPGVTVNGVPVKLDVVGWICTALVEECAGGREWERGIHYNRQNRYCTGRGSGAPVDYSSQVLTDAVDTWPARV